MIERILDEIHRLRQKKERLLIAIDGRCASGKTTLAGRLQETLSCNVVHMDDFFLRPEQRTEERYGEPGGNVDRERFLAEVLQPLQAGIPFSYRPFDCHRMALGETITVIPAAVTIIEGTYSCHPELWDFYDLRFFLTITPEEQRKRLAERNAEKLAMFCEKWIPLEEQYFAVYKAEEKCEFVILHTD